MISPSLICRGFQTMKISLESFEEFSGWTSASICLLFVLLKWFGEKRQLPSFFLSLLPDANCCVGGAAQHVTSLDVNLNKLFHIIWSYCHYALSRVPYRFIRSNMPQLQDHRIIIDLLNNPSSFIQIFVLNYFMRERVLWKPEFKRSRWSYWRMNRLEICSNYDFSCFSIYWIILNYQFWILP